MWVCNGIYSGRACTHTRVGACANTHTHSHWFGEGADAFPQPVMCTHRHTQARMCLSMQTHRHTHTQTHTSMHTCACVCTHARPRSMAEIDQILTNKYYSANKSPGYLDQDLCKYLHFNCWKLIINGFSFKSQLVKINPKNLD